MILLFKGHPEEVKPVKCVVSLGTGRPPVASVNDIDVYKPTGIFDAYKVVQGATSLIKLLVEQVRYISPWRKSSNNTTLV